MTTSLPTEMRCVIAPDPGGPEAAVIAHRPVPRPRAGEVLVRVRASSVSRPDTIQRQGLYPPPPGAPDVLGLELAGEIAGLGADVEDWQVGDQVCALTIGGNADFCVVPAALLLPVPDGLTMLEAASLPENLCTAWDAIVRRGHVRGDETVLVHGGSSGLGSMAIQLATALGASVATTAGSEAKTAFCRELGADLAVNYHDVDFLEAVKEWTSGRGVDFIVDLVGADYMQRNLQALALDGRLSVLANLAEDSVAPVDLRVMLRRRLTIKAATLKARSVEQKAEVIRGLRTDVWPLFASGAMKPAIDSVFPLGEVAAAHAQLESSQHMGKIVLDLTAEV
ncbi:NAD(P)H-quinone oxidoreductase [Streptomyces antimycoticus]|uniref:NAD(P)H-quinone oxidoreductase n=1 Tax=Streptomyces antimycoticus TaxID=68175 RepID=UPI000A3AF40F|nr:NAD(P)H-quinone oxidoreductase [Streptomyces antimycoticus]